MTEWAWGIGWNDTDRGKTEENVASFFFPYEVCYLMSVVDDGMSMGNWLEWHWQREAELPVAISVLVSPFHDRYNMHWADAKPGARSYNPTHNVLCSVKAFDPEIEPHTYDVMVTMCQTHCRRRWSEKWNVFLRAGKPIPLQDWTVPVGSRRFQEVEAPRFQDSRRTNVVRLSVHHKYSDTSANEDNSFRNHIR